MLGIFLIYFIGKTFYNLAISYDKSKWGYAIIGVLSYYFGTFVGEVILAITIKSFSENEFYVAGLLINAIALLFGLSSCWIVYKSLERNWAKKKINQYSDDLDILDVDLIEEELK